MGKWTDEQAKEAYLLLMVAGVPPRFIVERYGIRPREVITISDRGLQVMTRDGPGVVRSRYQDAHAHIRAVRREVEAWAAQKTAERERRGAIMRNAFERKKRSGISPQQRRADMVALSAAGHTYRHIADVYEISPSRAHQLVALGKREQGMTTPS